MKIVVLDAATFGADLDLAGFGAFGEVAIHQLTAPEERRERLRGATVAVTNKVVLDREILAALPELRLVCIAATGMNNVDLEAAAELGITVRNVAGYSTASVVQHTFALLFFLLEQLPYYDAYVKEGGWARSPIFTHLGRPFWQLAGKRWGIVGLGTIGRQVARTARAFGCEVVYYSTSGRHDDGEFCRLSLDDLLRGCQVVSIHAPLNARTRNLISRPQLELLPPGAVLLNLGRGGIVNEIDLARILDERELLAGLDVLEQEPPPAGHPLLRLRHPERLLLTPHIAWASRESRAALLAGVYDHIREYRDGSH